MVSNHGDRCHVDAIKCIWEGVGGGDMLSGVPERGVSGRTVGVHVFTLHLSSDAGYAALLLTLGAPVTHWQ